MQKFVVKKSVEATQGNASHVRLCGYLKKKRIKVGGWKKLYFVLQNQLLLSYNSKEDYEERLAPFKDVINLVPGTQILPMHQNRFTIETTGKVFYIFRCDDAKTCSEWIIALMESLNSPDLIACMSHNFHIPKPMFCDASGSSMVITRKLGEMQQPSSQQFDSLNFYGENSGANRQIARLPIAPLTAKILQRGSFHEDESEIFDAGNGEVTTQNFRLHDEFTSKQAEHQSIDVSRINSMFHARLEISKQPTTTTTILNGGDCVENTVNLKKLIKCEIVQNSRPVNEEKQDNEKRVVTALQNPKSQVKIEQNNNESKLIEKKHDKVNIHNKNDQDKSISLKTNNKGNFLSQITNSGKGVFDNMKKFIVKRSATNSSTDFNRNLNGQPVNSSSSNDTLDTNTNVKENTDVVDYCNVEEQIQNITLEDEDYEDENDNASDKSTKESFSSPYLTISNSYQVPSSLIKRNSYQNITQIEIPSSPTNSPKNSLREIGTNLTEVPVSEPVVYATINLEDKHSRRAQRSPESPEKEINTNDELIKVTSDYEEVGMYIENDGSEDETIYEPVEIPKSTNHAAQLWQNIKRINVDALWLDLTRKMREKNEIDENTSENPHTFTTFRDFKKKLGDHRRSLKARMQKMVHRSEDKDSPPNEDGSDCSSSHSQNTKNGIPLPGLTNAKLFAVNENVIKDFKKTKSGNNIASRASKLKARITFGSLGRVKKSRTSMFFEEFIPAKSTTKHDLQNVEFKRELMSVVCESRKEEQIATERCHNLGHESI